MARLVSQSKGGFYPAAPEAVACVLDRLLPPRAGEPLVLDPCAGEGRALLQIVDGLEAEPFGVELDEGRGAVVKALLGEQAIAPGDFLRTAITARSFSLCLCNPPYDYATGEEGRLEVQFLRRATDLLTPGGIMAFVCPESVAASRATAEYFEAEFEDISALPFPDNVRQYGETVILGSKRMSHTPQRYLRHATEWLDSQLKKYTVYDLPPGRRPRVFRKSEPTDAELIRLVAASPLRFRLDPPTDREENRPRPPLSIGAGHRALLLASGFVDGLICPPDERPHVIRGSAIKESYVASCDTDEDERGNLTTKTVISEKPRLLIRVLDADGTLTTLE